MMMMMMIMVVMMVALDSVIDKSVHMCVGQTDLLLPCAHFLLYVPCVFVCVCLIYERNTANCNHLLKAEVCISSYVILHTHVHTRTHHSKSLFPA